MKAFDIRPIINNFYGDIYDDPARSDWEAYALLIAPAVFAQISIIRPIDSGFISTASTTLAILFGFTFSSLLTTAKYTAKEDKTEQMVVRQTRLGTSYALLMNLATLVAVIGASILVKDFGELSYTAATMTSATVYVLLFHYLIVMVYLMRYFYLLAIGGAFEEEEQAKSDGESQNPSTEVKVLQ